MKKEWKALLALILSVWIFVMGFELGSYKEKRDRIRAAASASTFQTQTNQSVPTAAPTAPPTTAATEPPTTAPTTEPTGNLPNTVSTEAPATTAAPTIAASLSKVQILQKVTTAMQKLEREPNMTARKTEKSTVTITECSAQALTGVINSMINRNLVDHTLTYQFTGGLAVGYDENGKAANNGEAVTAAAILPPEKAGFTLKEDGISEATAKQSGSETVYTIKLKPETTTAQNPVPPYHASAIGYLDLAQEDLPGVTIERADMEYPGSVFMATVGADGRITKLDLYVPMRGSGAARLALLSGSASFEGSKTANWTFTY